jgi:hypothetical protein
MPRIAQRIALALLALLLPLAASAVTITPTTVSRATNGADLAAAGLTTATGTTTGGDTCANDGRTMLRVKNSSAANNYALSVTGQQTVEGQAVAALAATIAVSADRLIGPFPTLVFNDANKRIVWTYATGGAGSPAIATDLKVQCLRLAP